MRVALDSSGKRIYADDPLKYKDCFCPVCGENLKHKKGKIYKPYFSHQPDSNCWYGMDKDSKSEWHIRMQDYFPRESQERRFIDKKTSEIHIADVYLDQSNTVLEFQHSPIDSDEFWKRTLFHVREGRRIVWLFDESSNSKIEKRNEEIEKMLQDHDAESLRVLFYRKTDNSYGRFKKVIGKYETGTIYKDRCYKWIRSPRSFLIHHVDLINLGKVSICVYTGTEGDIFHRIVNYHNGFDFVVFSIHDIQMNTNIDPEEFFVPETKWQEEEPWKEKIEILNKRNRLPKEIADEKICSVYELWNPNYEQMIIYNTEDHKCYLIKRDLYRKGKMMLYSGYGDRLSCKYVTWNFLRGKANDISSRYYPLNKYEASKKVWILVRALRKE